MGSRVDPQFDSLLDSLLDPQPEIRKPTPTASQARQRHLTWACEAKLARKPSPSALHGLPGPVAWASKNQVGGTCRLRDIIECRPYSRHAGWNATCSRHTGWNTYPRDETLLPQMLATKDINNPKKQRPSSWVSVIKLVRESACTIPCRLQPYQVLIIASRRATLSDIVFRSRATASS